MSGLRKSGTYLRVLHDYSYTGHDGSPVSIKAGEECLLLKRSTPEWWYVIRHGDKKPIYVPANYMEEIHKTVIRVTEPTANPSDSRSNVTAATNILEKKKPPQPAPKPTRPAPTPQQRPTNKKKGPPPRPPAKPIVRKVSDEEEVLQKLDNILANAFDHIDLIPEETADTEESPTTEAGLDSLKRGQQLSQQASPRNSLPRSETSSKSNSLQRGAGLQPESNSSSRTNSLQRGVTPPNTGGDQGAESNAVIGGDEIVSAAGKPVDEPAPDYDEEDEGNHSNSSPSTGRHGLPSPKETFDSGISEGSTECLDKDSESLGTTSNENSMERGGTGGVKRMSQELPNYENIGNVQRLSVPPEADSTNNQTETQQPEPSSTSNQMADATYDDEQPDYANISDIQANIHVDSPPAQPPVDAQPVETTGDWRRYKIAESGRFYFYNVVSKETTWIAPKRILREETTNTATGSEDGPLRTDQSEDTQQQQPAEEPVDLPEGWEEEKQVDGSTAYINKYSSKKWRRSCNTTGKTYFYEEGSGETSWQLPQLDTSAVKKRPVSNFHEGLKLGLGHKYRASWAPGEGGGGTALHGSLPQSTAFLHAKLKAVGVPLMPCRVKSATADDSVVSDSRDTNGVEETRDKFDVEKNLSRLEGIDPSHFTNPRKFLRFASSPGHLESCYNDIATPRPALQQMYSEHFNPGPQNMSVPILGDDPAFQMFQQSHSRRKGSILPAYDKVKEKQGPLKITKVLENGKKSKKDWKGAFVSVKCGSVFIYKDQKSSTPKANLPQGKPESVVDLKGANVENGGKEVTSKKNVVQITTADDSRYLLQCEDELRRNEWYSVIQVNMDNPEQLSSSQPELSRDTTFKPIDDTPASMMTRTGKKSATKDKSHHGNHHYLKKILKTGTSDRSSTPTEDLEKSSKIRQLLFKWLYSRPSVESLREKGIYKDAVFGNHLHRICDRDESNIPIFVSKCINAIERRGLHADGLYRISGNMSQIQKLRLQVDSGFQYNLDSAEWEIHVLTGTLKLFFRELKEPVVPFTFFERFLTANQAPKATKDQMFRDTIKVLPASNRETMKVLFHHLYNVMQQSSQNRMQVQNIAIVFGPTLMWPEEESSNVAITMVQSGQVVEYILNTCQKLF